MLELSFYVLNNAQVQSMVAQWEMLKDPSNANLKDLFTKWRSLLAQDTTLPTTQIPDPEKLVNLYVHAYVYWFNLNKLYNITYVWGVNKFVIAEQIYICP